MKTVKPALVTLAMTFTGMAMADSSVDPSKIHFRGDRTAIKACQAVIRNDVGRLKHLLHDLRNELASAYKFREVSPEISGSITCNGMRLDEFSQRVSANHISNYLATDDYIPSEQMTAAADSPE